MTAEFFAHSGNSRTEAEPVALHLRRVAERARGYAEPLGFAEAAEVAGWLHDLGKYTELFQKRLRGEARGLDHWSAGAAAALTRYRQQPAAGAVALAIAGHHVGLPDKGNLQELYDLKALDERLRDEGRRLTATELEPLLACLATDGFALPEHVVMELSRLPLSAMLDFRLLFSTLVDADYLATELHFEGEDRRAGPPLEPARTAALVEARLAALAARGSSTSEVQAVRNELSAACRDAADSPTGLFTLAAPTGSGKTLAMLLFALRHAARHGLERVILALPYLSILDQTAREYRGLFESELGPLFVVEHHGLAELGDEDDRNRGAATELDRARGRLVENWDAPIVLTTNVQLLESLFAHRPGRCRKLHRVARSVVLFDEVQTLPAKLAVPTLGALSRVAERFGSTIVFATATQPAFDGLDEEVTKVAAGGWRPRPIVPDEQALFRLRRTRVDWRLESTTRWPELADELAGRSQGLAIVNLKAHAQALAEKLGERVGQNGFFHVSTNLCPAHREAILAAVRVRLERGEPCRLASTSCLEAGVDVSFPAVFRALAPLEAIAQAAGRCNRHGTDPELGRVTVFRPEEEAYPPGGYGAAAEVTRALFREFGPLDLDDPTTFRRYYERLYAVTGRVAGWKVGTKKRDPLAQMIQNFDFPQVAATYRLIDAATVNVLVPWDRNAYDALREELAAKRKLTRGWVRRARPHSVALFRNKALAPGIRHFLDPVPLLPGVDAEDWFIYRGRYDEKLGVVEAEQAWIG